MAEASSASIEAVCAVAGFLANAVGLWRLREGGAVSEIGRGSPATISRNPTLAISPDEKQIAFMPGTTGGYSLVAGWQGHARRAAGCPTAWCGQTIPDF